MRRLVGLGLGLPEAGRAIGVSLKYGAEAGEFGTERYSRLLTEEGMAFYDLKELKLVSLPAQACALTSTKVVSFSQEPMMFNARGDL